MRYRFVMGPRRVCAALLAISATIASVAGCGLISGADDLEVDPLFGSESGATPEGGVVVEAGVLPRREAGTDGAPVVDARDAAIDGKVDGGTRIRAVTLEGASPTGPFGFDLVSGPTILVSGGLALAGSFSLRIDKDAFGRVTFPDKAEIYATVLVRFENIGLNTSTIVSFGGATLMPAVELSLDKDIGLQLIIGSDPVATGGPVINQTTTYRIGFHVRQGGVGASLAEVFVAVQGLPFGPPAMRSTARALGAVRSLSVGTLAGNTRSVFDDVIVDSASMPPPSP